MRADKHNIYRAAKCPTLVPLDTSQPKSLQHHETFAETDQEDKII